MRPRRIGTRAASALLACLLAPTGFAQQGTPDQPLSASAGIAGATPPVAATATLPLPPPAMPAGTRSGREIYRRFRTGLAETDCPADRDSPRWRKHFAAAPQRLAEGDDRVLALFGYVVDAVRAASLPTEYALIPFVESGYNPAARSGGGPAGMWQFIKLTARDHDIEIRNGYDGRLSPVDSTRAAVRYLKTLHGMFAGDWRLAAMAYNAGEYRLFGALRRSGQVARSVDHDRLPGLSGITRAYPRKIHAISCLLQQADDRKAWLQRLQRPVPVLAAIHLTDDTRIKTWAAAHDTDAAWLRQLNPVYRNGRIAASQARPRPLLAPVITASTAGDAAPPPVATTTEPPTPIRPVATGPAATDPGGSLPATAPEPRIHVVRRGDSLWAIARRYRVRLAELLARNQLESDSVLQPGMILKIDAD